MHRGLAGLDERGDLLTICRLYLRRVEQVLSLIAGGLRSRKLVPYLTR